MEFNFGGKKILVTGAGKGFGRAISIALAKAGCKVYALTRTKADLDSLVEEYPDIVPITQDLSDWEESRAVLEKLETLDGLVNNAGAVYSVIPALDFTKEQLDQYIQNNLYTAINCTQVVARKMIAERRPGSIVNVSSILGQLSFSVSLGYGLPKAGMDFATKQFALELGQHNIRVNSINPTMVDTPLTRRASALSGLPFYDMYVEQTTLGRLPTVVDIVSPVLYLLSEGSASVTGTINFIDAGSSCHLSNKHL